jgi:hypothetical protein
MSFREKSAWISFVLLLLIFSVYFLNFARVLAGSRDAASDFSLFVVLILAFILGEIVLHVLIAIQSPQEARTPRDERERLIDLKATRLAFFVLMTGALASIGTMHLHVGQYVMAHSVLFAVVVAELVKLGGRIVFYRRGA